MKFPKLKNPLILAPMAAITDIAFRQLCRKHGAGMCFTEMVSSDALARNNESAIEKSITSRNERPVGIQLFGNEIASIAKSADFLIKNRIFDVLDFNMGCPDTKVMKQGAGSALLKKPKQIREIIEALSSTGIPVSAKIRIGIKSKSRNIARIARICEKAGACAITVHPRIQSQWYSGKADWSYIKLIKKSVSIPVIGNGDIKKPEDAERMLRETKCNYVMVGRAARGNPFIFSQCVEYFKKGAYREIQPDKRIKAFFEYLKLANRHELSFGKIKSQANYFTKGIFEGAKLRCAINKSTNINQIINILEEQRQ